MENTNYVVYQYTSYSTGMAYIGFTRDLRSRQKHHKKPSNNSKFSQAIKDLGWEDFRLTILAYNLTLDEAKTLENKSILANGTLYPKGYNMTTGGFESAPAEVIRIKLSTAQMGNTKCVGRKLSQETKNKMAKAKIGNKNRSKAA